MRTYRAVAALAVAGFLLAGCSGEDEGEKDTGKKSADSSGGAQGGGDDMVSVEFQVTGDSPASVSIPGINSSMYTGKETSGGDDLSLDEVKTPWSKKVKLKRGRTLNVQAGSKDPQKEITCRILIDGEEVAKETERKEPDSTLTTSCSAPTMAG